ncbi:hypothetical protein BJ508DRAFT_334725 [Ascobolus immersus RN42]|uniref:Uncharacterized protein n=1 Tax=Ascobolus immersus RN42 TaxID=1160509 RepID=A0A3N4HKX6_ASCIM|nr:hypothetical protein BJ508DRAFT_334725 [Ascobolus immersus RN42]
MNGIRQILDNSYPDHPWKATLDELQKEIPSLCTGFFWGQSARCSTDNGTCSNTRGPGSLLNIHHESRFPDIKLGALIGRYKAMDMGYPTNLSNLKGKEKEKIFFGLDSAYESYGYKSSKSMKVPFELGFENGGEVKWWEWISVFDTEQGCKLTYRPGMVILILENLSASDANAEPETMDSFAEIIGILTHRNPLDGKDYVFFNVRWLGELDDLDDETDLPRYKIQKRRYGAVRADDPANLSDLENTMESWSSYIAMPALSPDKFPYFVKDTTTRDEYIRNDYYFKSV